MSNSGSVMVLNGESKLALDVVRCLGWHGLRVMVGSYDPNARCFSSRYCQDRFIYNGQADDESRHRAILQALYRFRPEVLMPIYDDTYRLILARADEYRGSVRLILPDDLRLFDFCNDKEAVTRFAGAHETPIPLTFYPQDHGELEGLRYQLPYPVVVKPRNEAGGRGITQLDGPQCFDDWLKNLKEGRGEAYPIIQEFVPGEDLEITLIVDHDRLLGATVDRVLQNYPFPYGPPIACETIRDDEIVQTYFRLLRAFSCRGIAHIDLRRDARDGRAKMIDFNPRLGGSSGVSIRAGVPLPYILYQLAMGRDIAPYTDYRLIKHRWIFFQQLRHFVDSPQKAALLKELMDVRRTTTEIDLTDPRPHFRVLAEVLKGLHNKLFARQRLALGK